MKFNEIDRAVESLRREIIKAEILIRTKKALRNMLGKRKSGRHVNASISNELRRWGIVHFPENIPMAQSEIVILAMRGSSGERQLQGFAKAMTENVNKAAQQDGAMVARSQDKKQICSECNEEYSITESLTLCPGYWDHPYNYSQGSPRYCLACWLGVGPNDVAKMDAEYAEQMMSMISTPSTGQWLKSQMAELGLTSRMLAETLGVTNRTVKNWEEKGLPINGTAARMVKETLEKFFKERDVRCR